MEDVSKMPEGLSLGTKTQHFRVTIQDEDTGETIYSHSSFGGIFCSVEDYKVLADDPAGDVDGNQQHMMWGHPALFLHAYLQLDKQVKKLFAENPQLRPVVEKFFGK